MGGMLYQWHPRLGLSPVAPSAYPHMQYAHAMPAMLGLPQSTMHAQWHNRDTTGSTSAAAAETAVGLGDQTQQTAAEGLLDGTQQHGASRQAKRRGDEDPPRKTTRSPRRRDSDASDSDSKQSKKKNGSTKKRKGAAQTGGRKRRAKGKKNGFPKMPTSLFLLFSRKHRSTVRKENPGTLLTDLAQSIQKKKKNAFLADSVASSGPLLLCHRNFILEYVKDFGENVEIG